MNTTYTNEISVNSTTEANSTEEIDKVFENGTEGINN
jgi:hypothetical protein